MNVFKLHHKMKTTVKQAKEQVIYVIEDSIVSKTNYYDWVMLSEDENKLSVRYNEEKENYEIWYHRVNQRPVFNGVVFDSETEAEDYVFQKTEEFDFYKDDQRNTSYYNSPEEAEAEVITLISDRFNIDKPVAESFRKKQLRVLKAKEEREAEHQKKQTIWFENQKQKIALEAGRISINPVFIDGVKELKKLSGEDKSKRSALLMKELLKKNGIEKIQSDFWQVFRILKKQAEKIA